MKKSHIVIIVVAAIIVFLVPVSLIFGAVIYDVVSSEKSIIQVEDYRLCKNEDDKDVIVVKYLIENKGEEPTALGYEADIYVYQDGVELTEAYDLPKKYNYDSEDKYKRIKGGKSYYAEIAYVLEDVVSDVEVEVEDYSLATDTKKKIFKIK